MNTITKRTAHLYLKFFAQCCLEMESVSQNNPKIKHEKKGQTFNVENIILRKKMHESNSGWKVGTGMLLSSHVIEIRKQPKHISFS